MVRVCLPVAFAVSPYHENGLEIVWSGACNKVHLAKNVVFQRAHSLIEEDIAEETHQNDLRIPLASVAPSIAPSLIGTSAFYNQNDRDLPRSVH
jgi:hypothetical protein